MRADSARGWVPVEGTLYAADGAEILKTRLADFREAGEGVWIPQTYSQRIAGRITIYKVEAVEVNIPIPPERLDLRFPGGTKVVDEIAGLQYRVDDGGGDLRALEAVDAEPSAAEPAETAPRTTPVPLSDEQLRRAAERAGLKPVVSAGDRRPWILPSLLGLGVLLAVVGVWKRRVRRAS
jgi:hypothetical protein